MSGAGDQDPPPASAVQVEGVFGGTRIATPEGWRPVEQLRRGDAVLTVDGPPQPLRLARHNRIRPAGWPVSLGPLLVPPGALDNRESLLLLSGQHVLLECDLAEVQCGEPFALVPAAALDGFRGIFRVTPPAETVAVSLGFAQEELVYAAGSTLLRCGGTEPAENPVQAMLTRARGGRSPALSLEQAAHLIACLVAEEAGAALRGLTFQAARARGANRP
ncbi:Hint domain-containing protein [Cereibacter sphaeroides]|uniref:Hint domain-containing protein n=1 Tax=Cereibacter sphaeroides TaxID=1063 RepID=UPI001F246B76|nr:Hint domain-containing protein [Cereibacter sphaeroides]MCE6961287.1 Hint domain-containing protein [Cereibacter sphaeroides]MCE6972099.1 Hint domain-containing protein [Cereibacter sphaeroides]